MLLTSRNSLKGFRFHHAPHPSLHNIGIWFPVRMLATEPDRGPVREEGIMEDSCCLGIADSPGIVAGSRLAEI